MQEQMYKNVVIGFGKGGKTLAKTLASKGEQVAIIEQSDKMYGGTCINIGCIPSKYLAWQASMGVPFETAIANKTATISTLRQKNYNMIDSESTATVINGRAKFLSDTRLEVALADGTKSEIVAERIFVNTGATTALPPIAGLDKCKNTLTSTDIMQLQSLPKRLLIVGAGYVGLEFATTFTKFGSKVTMLDISPNFIAREDDDIAKSVLDDMTGMGVEFFLGVTIKEIKDSGSQSTITFVSSDGKTQTQTYDKILIAAGRRPNTSQLGLDNTSVKLTDRGAIQVDDTMRTTAPNIWAMGDVTGGLQFTYTSLDDFRILFNNLYGDKTRRLSDRKVVPYTVFIDPPLSTVGLTQKEAQRQGLSHQTLKVDVAATPRGNVISAPKGMLKVTIDPTTNLILGATLYAQGSQELINMLALCITNRIPFDAIKNGIFTHPSICEGLNDLK